MNYPPKTTTNGRSQRSWHLVLHGEIKAASATRLAQSLEALVQLARENAYAQLGRDLSRFDCKIRLELDAKEARLVFDFDEKGVIGDDEILAYSIALRVLHAMFHIVTIEGHAPSAWGPLLGVRER